MSEEARGIKQTMSPLRDFAAACIERNASELTAGDELLLSNRCASDSRIETGSIGLPSLPCSSMGISGLLPVLKSITRPGHISNYKVLIAEFVVTNLIAAPPCLGSLFACITYNLNVVPCFL